MTIEEKAKAYDEALEKAKKKYNSKYHPSEEPSGVYLNNIDLEEIFPELKESEDERIRKFIVDCIEELQRTSTENAEFNGQCSEALAYLEGLKEPKPIDWPNLSNCIRNCKKCQGKCFYRKEPYEEQKPAEWSEEDEDMRYKATAILNKLCASNEEFVWAHDTLVNVFNWLKSLRPQPRKEIYQAAKHDLAIRFMNYLDENRPNGKMSLSNGECEDIDKAFIENDWAKILRYVEKYSPSWKPSEEQIRVLLKANPVNLMPEELSAYNSLCNDIQKLM